jgi:serine/threonine protein kinase
MGDTIGRYHIRRELGRGAQSAVYLAFDPQLEREVAIKTLHFARADRERNRQLLEEARIVGRLKHPNLVPIFDAGSEGGDVYLVFEYFSGTSLQLRLRQGGAWPVAKAMSLMLGVLDALAYAHEHGVVHRDLKPSNILLDPQGVPRVMDFGIATRLAAGTEATPEKVGTPAYMAPEYLSEGKVGPSGDVFAAGLVLFELIYGRRAVSGTQVYQVIHQIANQSIHLPDTPVAGLDEAAAAILRRALARLPEERYGGAREMRAAIQTYLEPAADSPSPVEGGGQGTVEFLLRRMRHRSDFPALSESVSAVNRLAVSEHESVHQLSESILRDFALTNKLLRLVNSAYYRQAGAGSISTVSRAIIVLGFDAVRSIAVSVLLLDHIENHAEAQQLQDEFLRAHLAGVFAREAAGALRLKDAEQAFVCALFRGLGRLLAQYYFAEESDEVRKLVQHKGEKEAAASAQVLGVSYTELGMAIAARWGLPGLIVESMRPMPEGAVPEPRTVAAQLCALAAFAEDLTGVVAEQPPAERAKALRSLRARYGRALALTEAELDGVLDRSLEELRHLAAVLHLNRPGSTLWRQIGQGTTTPGAAESGEDDAELLRTTRLEQTEAPRDAGAGAAPAEVPPDARGVLSAGIADITQALVEETSLNDLLRIILETMYRAMGFQRVLLGLREASTNSMIGRLGFGTDAQEAASRLRFSLAPSADVFHLAMARGADLLISDVEEQKIRARIPDWYRKKLGAGTFMLFPLLIKDKPIALIYADKAQAGSISVGEGELALLRTLRNQALLALKQKS